MTILSGGCANLTSTVSMSKAELTRRAVDGVNVSRNLARVDDRVHASKTDATRAFHAPEGMGAAHKACRGDEN
jgi:hypothetical protein